MRRYYILGGIFMENKLNNEELLDEFEMTKTENNEKIILIEMEGYVNE